MDDAKARAERRRRTWKGRLTKLENQRGDPATTTVEQRLACMWELAQTGWLLARRELPEYERCEMPGRVIADELS